MGGRGIRDRQEINWTFWGSSVPQVWSRRLSQTGGVVGYSEDLAIEKRPKKRCNWASKSPSYFLPVPKTENDPESLPVVADRSPDSKVISWHETVLTSPRLQALPEARSPRASGTRRRHQGEWTQCRQGQGDQCECSQIDRQDSFWRIERPRSQKGGRARSSEGTKGFCFRGSEFPLRFGAFSA